MSGATPGQAAAMPTMPELYARWLRVVRPGLDDEDVTRNWRGAARSDRKFWNDLAAERDTYSDAADFERKRVIDMKAMLSTLLDRTEGSSVLTDDERDEYRARAGLTP